MNDIKEHESSKVAKGGHGKQWSAALQLLIVGFYVPLSLLIPTGFGFLLDRKASHEFPLYALIGLGVGTVIMVYGVYRMVIPFIRESKQQGKENQLGRPIMTTIGVLTGKRKRTKRRDDG